MTLWDHLENLTVHKKPWHKLTLAEQKTANMFMINRFISMKYDYIGLVNEIQLLKAPPSYMYDLYIEILPKQKQYFKYVKKSIKEVKGDEVEILQKIFEISEREAKDYVELLTEKQLESLKQQIKGIKEK